VCGNAFSVWRSGAFKTVFQTIEETVEETNQKMEEHDQRKNVVKDNNCNKASKKIVGHNTRNVFSAWRNVAKYIKS
jgi:hypothetical protein